MRPPPAEPSGAQRIPLAQPTQTPPGQSVGMKSRSKWTFVNDRVWVIDTVDRSSQAKMRTANMPRSHDVQGDRFILMLNVTPES